MLDTDTDTTIQQNCLFFKKSKKNTLRKRQIDEGDTIDDTTSTVNIIKVKRTALGGLRQTTSNPDKIRNYESSDDDEQIRENKLDLVTVQYKSTLNEKREGPSDMGATQENQIDTEYNKDAQAVYERSLETNKNLKGKADDKIYRGLNNYAQYIEKKDSLLGNAASNMVRKGPMRAPSYIRSTTRWDYQPDLCKDYLETGFCGFGDSCKFGHDRTDYKFGWQLEQEWNEGKYGQEDLEAQKYEVLAEILANERADELEGLSTSYRDRRDAEMPHKCPICRRDFTTPIQTKCYHHFCERCALTRYKTNSRCFVCGAQTHGFFAPASDLIKKLGLEKSKKAGETTSSESESDNSEEHHNHGCHGDAHCHAFQNEEEQIKAKFKVVI